MSKRKIDKGEGVAQPSLGERLILALAHPYRVHALHLLNKRVSSPKEMAAEVGCSVSTMSYHVRMLVDGGFAELVREEPRRGAREHYYRGTRRAIFVDEDWVLVPEPIRAAVVGMQLKVTGRLLGESLATGVFEQRSDRHHSLHEAVVDEQGWKETMVLLENTMQAVAEIERRSAERASEAENSPAPSVPLVVSLIGFERAPTEKGC